MHLHASGKKQSSFKNLYRDYVNDYLLYHGSIYVSQIYENYLNLEYLQQKERKKKKKLKAFILSFVSISE